MKCWKTGQSGDLSFTMVAMLTAGIAMWVVYGFLKSDYVIITPKGEIRTSSTVASASSGPVSVFEKSRGN